jgi:uncharacterized protein (TIGR02231 family)
MNLLNPGMYTTKKYHMKKQLTSILFLSITALCFGNDKTNNSVKKASLKAATVYTSGVQLRSTVNYSAVSGVNNIIIEGISASIDPNTIQVSATGKVVILDSKYTLYYPENTVKDYSKETKVVMKKIQLLKDSLEFLGFDLRDLQEQISVYNETKTMIKNNGLMKNQGKVNDSIGLLKEAIALYTAKMNSINKSLIVLSKKKTNKEKQKARMNKRMSHLQGRLNNFGKGSTNVSPIPRITVSLIADGATNGKIDFSYLSANASWTPLYDIRSESSEGKIYMNYKAEVQQQTGLDWKNVKLSISTNNPYANKTKPELNPWYLSYVAYRNDIKLSVNSNNRYKALSNAPAQAITNRGYSLQESEVTQNEEIGADQFTKLVKQLTAAEFKIELPYTIASNGHKHMVLVQKSELETNFKYYAVPKLDASVYLVAEMLKIDDLQLIPSKANIFFDGSYIGETYIDPTTMNDTLYLSLGKDPNISISRRLLSSKCKEKSIGDKIEKTLAYTIEIKNMKSSPIEVVIQDQIPITTDSNIEIDKVNLGKGNLQDRTGLIEWKVKLAPKDKKIFDFDYRIKFDKGRQINI